MVQIAGDMAFLFILISELLELTVPPAGKDVSHGLVSDQPNQVTIKASGHAGALERAGLHPSVC